MLIVGLGQIPVIIVPVDPQCNLPMNKTHPYSGSQIIQQTRNRPRSYASAVISRVLASIQG